MKNIWEKLKAEPVKTGFATGGASESQEATEKKTSAFPPDQGAETGTFSPPPGPIEPGGGKRRFPGGLKWILFLVLVLYLLLAYYQGPILKAMGAFLVEEHPLPEAELLVCVGELSPERALAAAELFEQGRTPRILVPRTPPPVGFEALKRRGISAPEPHERFLDLLGRLGVPEKAVLTTKQEVASTLEAAKRVREICRRNGIGSVLLLTSPYHTRRAWTIYRHVFRKERVRLGIVARSFSRVPSKNWWTDPALAENVLTEYLKLIYHYAVR